jgi:hypothetical protein
MGWTGICSSGRAARSATPIAFSRRRSAGQAAIPLALAFASSIAVISSSWSKSQNR